jgi:hypothetical protein
MNPVTMREQQEVLDWARAQSDGPVEVELIKTRPWATTWRLRGRTDVRFLKAAGIASHYEAPLLESLHRIAPDLVAPVLAVEPNAGWLLLGDAGRTLDEQLGGRFDGPAWVRMLVSFAELQRQSEPLTADLIAAGVPDERPARLDGVLRQLLADSTELADLTRSEHRALLGRADLWAQAELDLAGLAVPPTVQHGDLHPGNVAGEQGGQPVRFFDFGDASIAHPFTTLLVPLQVARHRGADEAEITRLTDGYLEVFSDRATLTDLRQGLDVALQCAVLPKATAWHRALLAAPSDHPWGRPVLEYLRDLR